MTIKEQEAYMKNLAILNLSIMALTIFTTVCVAAIVYYTPG